MIYAAVRLRRHGADAASCCRSGCSAAGSSRAGSRSLVWAFLAAGVLRLGPDVVRVVRRRAVPAGRLRSGGPPRPADAAHRVGRRRQTSPRPRRSLFEPHARLGGMQIVIAGASGFLGTQLTEALIAARPRRARAGTSSQLGSGGVELGPVRRHLRPRGHRDRRRGGQPGRLPDRRQRALGKKWARELRESRVRTTATLAEAIASSDRRPAFLAGNGIGVLRRPRRRGGHRGVREPRRRVHDRRVPGLAGRRRRRPSRRALGSACCGPRR